MSANGTSSATRATAAPAGCLMCDSLYVKANGDMPCWDDVGERLILRRLRLTGAPDGDGGGVFESPELLGIRRAFLEGRLPHPELCRGCAVLGHGRANRLRPSVMNVLHVEPAFLCQLSCPQCFTPRERLAGLQEPPYYMPVEFFERLLQRLAEEGVTAIRLVHFEGRGDPLLHRRLGEMVALARHHFPGSVVMATSHGNFPFRSWMVGAGLDVLRLSVDGAFEESYQRYRVGGTLAAPLELMRSIRDVKRSTGGVLHVEWKYILFEWNDRDDELREAARLAKRLGVRLRFCLTHTEGRSQRFPTGAALREALTRLDLDASLETTFQLRREGSRGDATLVLAEHVEALLLEALALYRAGEAVKGELHLREALLGDPGEADDESLELESLSPTAAFESAARRCRFPSTASALANVALALGEPEAAEALFRRYLTLGAEATDREAVIAKLVDLAVCNRLGCKVHDAAHVAPWRARDAERAALEIDLGTPARGAPRARLARLLQHGRPVTLLTVGGIRRVRGELRAARALLTAYLERVPGDEAVAGELRRVGAEMRPVYRLKRLARKLLGSRLAHATADASADARPP